MNEPDSEFPEIRFNGFDAWDCIVPYEFPHSATRCFSIHIWADESGPTEAQRIKFRNLKLRYNALWPAIASRIVEVHDYLDTTDGVAAAMPMHLGMHIGEHFEDSVEFVIHLDLDEEGYRGYFLLLDDWTVCQAIVAD
jgi:hypothetical protein